MAYDQNTRNRLQRFVSEARILLSGEFTRQFQQKYGLDPTSGEISELGRLAHLNDRDRETARMLRDTLAHYLAQSPSGKRDCLERMVREQAFTVLNRLCALRMAEAREIIIESVTKAYKSKGFQLYARVAGSGLGETGDAYRAYLFSLFDELALDLPVLFDRFSPQGCLFPGEPVLLELLAMINESDLASLWAEDETIGWVYQYFNTSDERRQMRADSQAPRNSRELAVRNQFFTPRYVVEFLTDNTLGRLWYEMTRGSTQLKDRCRYLVRRPQEIFLSEGENPPEQEESPEELDQEEMLQRPVYIPYRPVKDPREILMLDPACGSMHFGLYAFDLYEKIYEEAWDLAEQPGFQGFERSENLQQLQQSYANKGDFLRDVPRLIVECNIHGVDIDPRAVQIAGLSLWLRAQRSWQCQGIKPQNRPQIAKSNVVCAEPMPGEKEMLEEFSRSLKPRVLGQLVEIIFDKMQLAGEAGSLLKIEEEIEEALTLAREEFRKELRLRNDERSTLFPDLSAPRQQGLFDFSDLGDKTRFWIFAEQKLLDSLREYAKQAEELDAVKKRLFAQDAARGFALIDLFRKRYDVVLMNPPFGESTKNAKSYITDNYAMSKQDLACAFVDCWLSKCTDQGILGAIIVRTPFFLSSSTSWRQEILLGSRSLNTFVDLGFGVLEAMVETAIVTIANHKNNAAASFIRLVSEDYKDTNLISCIHNIRDERRFEVCPSSFGQVPNSPFCYWVSDNIRNFFTSLPPLGDQLAVKQGLATADDFRFVRAWWEVPQNNEARTNEETMGDKCWVPFAKGGVYSPYYDDVYLVINWGNCGEEIRYYKYAYIRNEQYYFRPGLTWPRRTTRGISVRILPGGCIFADKGPAVFGEELLGFLGLMNSTTFETLITLQVGAAAAAARSYEVGVVQRTPIPENMPKSIGELALQGYLAKRKLEQFQETARVFTVPALLNIAEKNLYQCYQSSLNQHQQTVQQLIELQKKVDYLASELYGTYTQDNKNMHIAVNDKSEPVNEVDIKEDTEPVLDTNIETSQCKTLVSWLFGLIFGRFDIRVIKGIAKKPIVNDPFICLPVCPPGMLQNHEGFPASSDDVPDDYPIRISWNGVLVDDEGHVEDLITHMRAAFQAIWRENADDIEQEACEILGIDSLREYFGKPSNFFADHLKSYSRSRRQAPIYWPLSTASGSFTLWIYYHRLSDQTLYRCVNDFVEPKLKQISEAARQLRQKTGRNRSEEKELEELINIQQELQEFRDELLRVAAFWKPNRNDGVQITAAPLWKLFRLPKWRTTLKDTWEKLEKGDYDWAHLAHSIWPERVREKCKHDKSLAIAHDLENLYEEPVAKAKKPNSRRKKNT